MKVLGLDLRKATMPEAIAAMVEAWLQAQEAGREPGPATDDREPFDCLAMLLGHTVRYHEKVADLLNMTGYAAVRDLANVGVRVDGSWLLVSNKTGVFSGSRWANQAHRDQLLRLPGATVDPRSAATGCTLGRNVYFGPLGSTRYVAIPLSLISTPPHP